MTLTADRRNSRTTARSTRPASSRTDPPALRALPVLDDVYRVLDGERTVGYVQVAGPVFVVLRGEVYNTSVEVAQCLCLETAVARLHTAVAASAG
jgi:hypothetical protein